MTSIVLSSMRGIMSKLRRRDPGEGFVSAWVIRPVIWVTFNLFSGEARAIRKYKKGN